MFAVNELLTPNVRSELVARPEYLAAVRQRVSGLLAVGSAFRGCADRRQVQAERSVARIGVVLRDQFVALRPDVRQRHNHVLRQLTLDGEVVVFGVGLPVVDRVARRIRDRQINLNSRASRSPDCPESGS